MVSRDGIDFSELTPQDIAVQHHMILELLLRIAAASDADCKAEILGFFDDFTKTVSDLGLNPALMIAMKRALEVDVTVPPAAPSLQ